MSHVFDGGQLGQCPECGCQKLARHSKPEVGDKVVLPTPGDLVICADCGHVCTIEQAVNAGGKPGSVR